MQKDIGWLWMVGFFGLVSAAGAQAPSSPTASTQFDGTYALVSSTAGSYRDYANRPGQCPERRPGPLTIAQGRVHWSNPSTGNEWVGTVGSHGELAMSLISQPGARTQGLGFEATASGSLDHDGTVRLHTAARYCSYDLVWQKEHK
jgi:hypothetical protein